MEMEVDEIIHPINQLPIALQAFLSSHTQHHPPSSSSPKVIIIIGPHAYTLSPWGSLKRFFDPYMIKLNSDTMLM